MNKLSKTSVQFKIIFSHSQDTENGNFPLHCQRASKTTGTLETFQNFCLLLVLVVCLLLRIRFHDRLLPVILVQLDTVSQQWNWNWYSDTDWSKQLNANFCSTPWDNQHSRWHRPQTGSLRLTDTKTEEHFLLKSILGMVVRIIIHMSMRWEKLVIIIKRILWLHKNSYLQSTATITAFPYP